MKFKTYQGYEYDETIKLLPLTKKTLRALKKNKSVIFERDDSLEGYESMRQLIEITRAIGINIFPEYLERLTKKDHDGYNHYPYSIALINNPIVIS
jgi:hypothetical protein